MTLVWGVAGIGTGLYVAGRGSLLSMAVRYVGYFAGPVLGVFLLGVLSRRANTQGVLTGVLASFAAVVVLVNAPRWWGLTPLGGIWMAAAGTVVCLVVGALTSLAAPPPSPERLRGLVFSRFRATS
jgi:SSS family solute:Na+ symporter